MLIELSAISVNILHSLASLDMDINVWIAFNLGYCEAEKYKCAVCYREGKFGFSMPIMLSLYRSSGISLFSVCNRFS